MKLFIYLVGLLSIFFFFLIIRRGIDQARGIGDYKKSEIVSLLTFVKWKGIAGYQSNIFLIILYTLFIYLLGNRSCNRILFYLE